ncbi:hypothetical protein PV328_001460 [Microctonus aethiopoides]|uniref:Suppressor APC domain-containing protein n=1 Tax=Microctonus aethiopoides TaxID=144406 RepID=A0AA39FXC1_9HYME|nr:hypothetical protein PV328_001460 [Microctonus aethiopoides]
MAQIQSSKVNELPPSFVNAMRTLFRIMDDENSGFVKYSDIEERWQDDGTQGLPRGVLESLKKVTPPNGLLTFERFCAGLKVCLLQIQNNRSTGDDMKNRDSQSINRPPSAPILITDSQSKSPWTSPNTAAIRPNNAISQQRTFSMPQLIGGRKEPIRQIPLDSIDNKSVPDSKLLKQFGPPKPPRTGAAMEGRSMSSDRNFDKSEIRTALQNWQVGVMMNEDKCIDKKQQLSGVNYSVDTRALVRQQKVMMNDGNKAIIDSQNNQLAHKKTITRRREPRRHTLQNGIDYNMMKRMKQIEQERDILLQGLAAVDKAREWYLKQISTTQEKIKHLSGMGAHVEQWTEAHQERLELKRARVLEVNRHLAALITSWDRGGLPMHMNLAFLNTTNSTHMNQDMLSRLKQQNYRLTEESNKKNHKIALLEQEKDSLMRELYNRQAGTIQSRRSTTIHEQHDQTFII